MWYLKSKFKQGERFSAEFSSREAAEAHLRKLGPIIEQHYEVVPDTGNAKLDRYLMEGLIKGDLEHILLPRISVDEYVPSDPATDNVVVAFFIKGVPDAVQPFKNLVEKSNGVLTADYGDSETIVKTSIVYAEFDRENLEVQDIHDLLIQAAMTANLEPEDFTMTFPHTNDKFPYDLETMEHYFISRNQRKNQLAQQKAMDAAQKEFEKGLEMARQRQEKARQQEQEPTQESLVTQLAGLSLQG